MKALLGARGVKERRERGAFVVEGLQSIRELVITAPQDVRQIFLTDEGRQRLSTTDLSSFDVIEVSDQVMAAMTDTVTPQGVLAVSAIRTRSLKSGFTIISRRTHFESPSSGRFRIQEMLAP